MANSVADKSVISAVLVHILVREECCEAFIEACDQNRAASVLEPGNLRFDLLRSRDNPCYFVLYEVYDSAVTAAAHKTTEHYLQWRDTVAPMMAQARRGEPFEALGI